MLRTIISILILIVSTSLGSAGTIHPSAKDSDHIKYGSEFLCVGKICGKYNDDTNFCASCVAISDKWILTAAHVVNNTKNATITINDKTINIIDIYIHKDFKDEFGKYDIALCLCENNIGLNFYPELYSDDDEIGKICTIAGYGLHGTFLTGAIKSDNLKRAGTNKIDNIYDHLLICSPSDKGKTVLEFLIGSGDSGGGLFIDQKLAGINSGVLAVDKNPNSSYTDESGHTRISICTSWIKSIIDEKK